MGRFTLAFAAFALTVAAIGSVAIAPPAAAQEADQEQQIDAYTALVEAVASDEVATNALKIEMARVPEELGKIPEFIEIEAECPGLIAGYASAIQPHLLLGQLDDYRWYRSQLDPLFRAEFTEAEALEGAEFFESALGRKYMEWVWSNQSVENILEEAIEDPDADTSRAAFDADRATTLNQMNEALSAEDQAAVTLALSGEFGRKLLGLQPRLSAILFEMFNRDYPPEVEAKLDETTGVFIEDHLTACEEN